ncbi:hypothetical protein [Synoicihabitans lomoniglobus]|uniref:Uncharacterized protein n=1 Tax=Synoicihabitans lomoniglobus TaxID=2909285 RepID=A0AAE9ZX02_9BACT|nr:hypothetical protein [Opitutaceae bacterium LMO-M01]WED64634.1 hypothetical protein PXH66_20010 [Opitutaceae bacterium LMO-M01]
MPTWRAPQSFPETPSPEQVLPTLPHRRLKIECLPSEPADTLPARVKQACHDRGREGLKLTSTFSHDGSVFLIFKLL